MTIRDWPPGERPREKLLFRGGDALSDAELLAIFLGSGRRGQTAVDLGRGLLTEAGGLKSLVEMAHGTNKLGTVAWCRVQAALELGRRYLAAELSMADMLTDPKCCARYLQARLVGYQYEVFACLFLDSRHRVLAFEELFRGTVNEANVHPREVVRRCLTHNAVAVIFAHNHPSGESEPSQSDRVLTLHLREALKLIDVRVLDHFIIGTGASTSLAERGWI